MRVLFSADGSTPRFEGQQLVSAARALGHEAALFDHPASRDPTLELPILAREFRPHVVVLVTPEREDPATVELLRARGARVVGWFGRLPDGSPGWIAARRRWLARALDRAFATHERVAADLADRHGRAASVLEPGYDPEALGIPDEPPDVAAEDASVLVAVRGADDPLLSSGGVPRGRVLGYGDARAFPRGTIVSRLERPERFAPAVAGRWYLAGARTSEPGPGVFADAIAAAAAGARCARVGYRAPLPAGPGPPLEAQELEKARLSRRIERLLERTGSRRDLEGGEMARRSGGIA